MATNTVYQSADREARYYNDSQQDWAVRKLYDLLDCARQFRTQVARYPQSPSYTAYDYRNLKRAFEEARESLYWAHFSSSIEYDFDRVERAIYQLDSIYWGY